MDSLGKRQGDVTRMRVQGPRAILHASVTRPLEVAPAGQGYTFRAKPAPRSSSVAVGIARGASERLCPCYNVLAMWYREAGRPYR